VRRGADVVAVRAGAKDRMGGGGIEVSHRKCRRRDAEPWGRCHSDEKDANVVRQLSTAAIKYENAFGKIVNDILP
jgi:hypothetical protein